MSFRENRASIILFIIILPVQRHRGLSTLTSQIKCEPRQLVFAEPPPADRAKMLNSCRLAGIFLQPNKPKTTTTCSEICTAGHSCVMAVKTSHAEASSVL